MSKDFNIKTKKHLTIDIILFDLLAVILAGIITLLRSYQMSPIIKDTVNKIKILKINLPNNKIFFLLFIKFGWSLINIIINWSILIPI
jgi:hypothetical protein